MKKIFTQTLLLLAAAFLCCACHSSELMDEFVEMNSDIGLTIKGENVLSYSDNMCQIGYLPSAIEFRVSDDSMNDYFVITLDKIPEVGSETVGKLIYTTDDDIVTKTGLHFKLLKTGNDGMMWLWNRKNAIGAVVRQL